MLAWPVAAARQSGLFDRILVSTEDTEIAAAAQAAGAEVMERPPELAGDRATVVDVCLDALSKLDALGTSTAIFCCLYATAAFVAVDDLVGARAMMIGPPPADFVMGVCDYDLPPLLALREIGEGIVEPMWPEYHHLQSQDFPRLVCSSGTFYWARTEPFRTMRSFYGPPLHTYALPRARALDIDTPEQYQEALLRADMLTKRGANG